MKLPGKEPEPKPYNMMKLTLTNMVQGDCLGELNQHFGISESYPETHEIICNPVIFAEFVHSLCKAGKMPLLSRMKPEMVDLKRLTRRTIIKYKGHAYNGYNVVTR